MAKVLGSKQVGRNRCQIPCKNGEKYIKYNVFIKSRNLFHGGMYCGICGKTRYFQLSFIIQITLQIKKDQRTLPTKFQLVMLFLHFQKRHWVQGRPCFTFCAYNVGVLHRGKSNQTFLKRRMMVLSYPTFLSESFP